MGLSKKKVTVIGSACLVSMSLIAGGATTANWSDAISLNGAEITAGNLDIEKIGDTLWYEKSLDSPNFGSRITLSDYRITPGDTIQARQDLDVALEGKNLRALFDVATELMSGDLYSIENGVSGSFMVVDENSFVVVPSTPLGSSSPETILTPEDVTPEVDGDKDYTFIVTVSFDANTPDRVRTQVQADLGTMTFSLNQIRDGLMQELPESVYSYALSDSVNTVNQNLLSGDSARFIHTITNTGSAPVTNVQMNAFGSNHDIIDTLNPGDSVNFIINSPAVTADTDFTFSLYGNTDNGVELLNQSTETVNVSQYSASVTTTSSSSVDSDSGNTSVIISHEITNNSPLPVYNMYVSANGLPDSNSIASVNPGETVTLYTNISNAGWSGAQNFTFTVSGEDGNSSAVTLNTSSADIYAGEKENILAPTNELVALGLEHTCEIRNGGQVWCWGRGSEGQLGNGATSYSTTPVRAGAIDNAVKVEAGQYNTFVITDNGDLWAWGDNNDGELGIGNTTHQSTPQKVNVTNVEKVTASGSMHHSAILLEGGVVKVAGTGARIGTNNTNSSTFVSPSMSFTDVKDVSIGGYDNLYVVNGDGTVWGTGDRRYKALNNYDGVNNPSFEYGWVQIGTHSDVELILGRYRGGVYERENGEIYGWGDNNQGELGIGSSGHSYLVRLPHYEDAKSLDYGYSQAIMIKNDGSVWTNGYNAEGQLGNGSTSHGFTPSKINSLSNITSMSVGHHSTSVVDSAQRYAWGNNANNSLGVSQNGGTVKTPQVVVR